MPTNERTIRYRKKKEETGHERISFYSKEETIEKLRKFMEKRNLATYDSFLKYILEGNYAKSIAWKHLCMEKTEEELRQMKEEGEYPELVKKKGKTYEATGNQGGLVLYYTDENDEEEYINLESFI